MAKRSERAAIYLRISDDRAGEGLGVARQRKDCEALIDRAGYELAGIYEDNDLGAYHGKPRPEWERLQADIGTGSVDVVVAWASDRLTRHPRELEDLVDLLDANGVRIQTVTSGDYDLATPEGRAYARIVGAIARQESERKSVRARRKALELAEAGKVGGGGYRPFGYETDRVTVRESEAVEIRWMLDRIIGGGSLQSVANELKDRGVRTTTGALWQNTTIRRLLISGRVAGLRDHRGEVIGPAVWDAIVDRESWDQGRAILLDPKRRTNNGRNRSYLLSGGLVRCGLCGEGLVARPASGRKPSYVCASSRTGKFKGCGKIRIMAEDVDQLVTSEILDAFDSPDFLEAISAESGIDTAALSAKIGEEDAKLERLSIDYYSKELIGAAEYRAARGAIEARLEELRADLVPARISAPSGRLPAWWEGAAIGERRELLKLAAVDVRIGPAIKGRNFFDPDRVTISYA